MSDYLKPAKESPRMEHQIIKWYNGDSFILEWDISLVDDDGNPYEYDADDELLFSFFTYKEKKLVHQFSFTNIQNNTVELEFTEAISKKFIPGTYTYCIKIVDHEGGITTLYANDLVEVEECH